MKSLWAKIFRKKPNLTPIYPSPLQRYEADRLKAYHEEMEFQKHMRNLKELEFSTDYLLYLLKKAANPDVQIKIENNGLILTLSKAKEQKFSTVQEPKTVEEFRDYMGFGEV
jgi:hypothetical protein